MIRARINEIHNRNTIEKISITKSWFFGEKLTKLELDQGKKKTQITKFRNERTLLVTLQKLKGL